MSQHHQQHRQEQRKPIMNIIRREDRVDDHQKSFVEMLNVMRRLYDLYGDPSIKDIIDRAELALASS